ncbi:MAG: DNA-3-methyladenine glycosylase 2 family protein [Chitinophagaceae bacterium]|nr:DNA-3-methyladenine glycosylase 2 family protein [Chitinophagaceae bacterium]
MSLILQFNSDNFHQICDDLASRDNDLRGILKSYGYPPMWNRPNTFESLVHIILEQQVSLASALASLNKLRERLKIITPENFVSLSDEELKACYFSRQKTLYVRGLAQEMIDERLNLDALALLSDDAVRWKLTSLKGIGNWTADIYLLFVLQRTNIFPVGDLAAVNALKQVKKLASASKDEVLETVANWHPYKSIATMILWHHYLSASKKKPYALNDSTVSKTNII